uniref:(northern house mosquito) hypothetical protein n=1 Tax=Culex pipiens TaxID=7175 RepID=A0A8D8HQW3_CULPI
MFHKLYLHLRFLHHLLHQVVVFVRLEAVPRHVFNQFHLRRALLEATLAPEGRPAVNGGRPLFHLQLRLQVRQNLPTRFHRRQAVGFEVVVRLERPPAAEATVERCGRNGRSHADPEHELDRAPDGGLAGQGHHYLILLFGEFEAELAPVLVGAVQDGVAELDFAVLIKRYIASGIGR